MTYMLLLNCALKLVEEIILYYDTWSIKHQISLFCLKARMSRNSSVGIVTGYDLDGPGIESMWGAKFSAPVRTGPGAQPASFIMGTRVFPGVKRPGRGANHPHSPSVELNIE